MHQLLFFFDEVSDYSSPLEGLKTVLIVYLLKIVNTYNYGRQTRTVNHAQTINKPS